MIDLDGGAGNFCGISPWLAPWHLCVMKSMAYCAFREAEFFGAQCLNVDVSSFGMTRDEAIANLKEAVELYFDGQSPDDYL